MTIVEPAFPGVRGGIRGVRSRADAFERQLERAASVAQVVEVLGRAVLDLRVAPSEPTFGTRFPRSIATREDIEHWMARMGPPPRSRAEPPALAALRVLFAQAGARMNDLGPRRA